MMEGMIEVKVIEHIQSDNDWELYDNVILNNRIVSDEFPLLFSLMIDCNNDSYALWLPRCYQLPRC